MKKASLKRFRRSLKVWPNVVITMGDDTLDERAKNDN